MCKSTPPPLITTDSVSSQVSQIYCEQDGSSSLYGTSLFFLGPSCPLPIKPVKDSSFFLVAKVKGAHQDQDHSGQGHEFLQLPKPIIQMFQGFVCPSDIYLIPIVFQTLCGHDGTLAIPVTLPLGPLKGTTWAEYFGKVFMKPVFLILT